MNTEETLDLLILAAGKGTRVGCDKPKQLHDLCGKPVFVYCLEIFKQCPYIGNKYLVYPAGYRDQFEAILAEYRIQDFTLVKGGETRFDSLSNGLAFVQTPRMITHNAVAPFVTKSLIDQVVTAEYDGVTTVTPMELTLCFGETFAKQSVPLDRLKLTGTPQSFNTEAYRECHQKARQEGYVPRGDTELLLRYGKTVKFVRGTRENIKITTRLDMILAQAILNNANTEHGVK